MVSVAYAKQICMYKFTFFNDGHSLQDETIYVCRSGAGLVCPLSVATIQLIAVCNAWYRRWIFK